MDILTYFYVAENSPKVNPDKLEKIQDHRIIKNFFKKWYKEV